MKRLSSYRIYLFVSVALFLLSACSSTNKVATNQPVQHDNREKEKELKETYATIVGVPAKDISYPLYATINEWYGTPYKFGGHSRQGVDCSDFASILFEKVYGISISGPCSSLLEQCKPIKEGDLKEGDLVFFKINSKTVSHVGVYLQNNKFVHASVHSGVVISDLTTDYYKKYFYKAGRIKNSLTQNSFKG
ncbi:MAG TPA: NlpC/P60 family protein [Bacteroidia bacterium]|jgi:lipoprotein Spr|nr:NlpC/P60 family protein [Bacteroidia bacterium]